MTRGRRPTTGLDDAIVTARARGEVMTFCPEPDRVCDFVIRSPGHVIFVRLQRVSRLHCSPKNVEAECSETIDLIRSLPGSGPVSRELWIYSRHGWRYFRIEDISIERIGKDGMPAPEPGKEPVAVAAAASDPVPATTPAQG